MHTLAELLSGFAQVNSGLVVNHIALDSREIGEGGVFFALAGHQQHGLQYAQQVQKQGALAIVYEPEHDGAELAEQLSGMALIAVPSLAEKLGEIAARFYARPSQQLTVIGITGTNGKTSCSQFLAQVLESTAVVGTLGWGVYPNLQRTCNTTPDAFALQKILAHLQQQQIRSIAMEVSSHGLDQGRVNAVEFSGMLFNNLSRDHLDYHGSMQAYFASKLRLVRWPGLQFAVVNLDDDYAEQVLAAIAPGVRILTYSLTGKLVAGAFCLQATQVVYSLQGIECVVGFEQQQGYLRVGLLGGFNLQNVLAVLATLIALGKPLDECLPLLQRIKPVIGRMECFSRPSAPLVVVDYAHTPDALSKALSTLRQHCQAKLTVVFGCGGDRDKGKRASMGQIAVQLADAVIVTDDNPRFEDSTAIIDDIITDLDCSHLTVIADRRTAIEHAIMHSGDGDVVLVAGKGHEDYQEIKGVRMAFSDRQLVQDIVAA